MLGSVDEAHHAEQAVRAYLLYLDDPAKLRDDAEVERWAKAARDATDPIDKLKAIAVRERAAAVDPAPLRAAFVVHALAWAKQAEIPVSAFKAIGVPDDVLHEAGFTLPSPQRRRRPAPPRSAPRRRARADDVTAWVLNSAPATFTVADVRHAVGAGEAMIRQAIGGLVAAGQVNRLGPAPDHTGPGRAPIIYASPARPAAA